MATNPIKTEAAAYLSNQIDNIHDWLAHYEWLGERGYIKDNPSEDEAEANNLVADEFADYVDECKDAVQKFLAGYVDGN